jgi:PAS domain S-box-containing protein
MTAHDRSRATLRLWLLLTAAFFVTAAAGGLVVLQLAASRTVSGARRDLTETARNLTLRVRDLKPDEARAALSTVRNEIPGARRVEYLTVVDGVVQGGVSDPGLAREAMATGTVVVSDSSLGIARDPSFVAYAPIRTADGIAALLVVDVRAQETLDDVRHLRVVGGLGLSLAGVLGAVFAACLARQLLRGPSQRRVLRMLRSRRFFRTTLVEIGLAAIAGLVFVAGMVGITALHGTRTQGYAIRVRAQSLEALHYDLVRAIEEGKMTPAIAHRARSLRLGGQGAEGLLAATNAALDHNRLREDQLHETQDGYVRGVSIAMVLSAALTLLALILLRATASREHDLDEAENVAARSEAARQQIAENLPIGFYTFGPDQIQYCNDAWRRLVEQGPEEESTEALGRALHPDEREAVLTALRDAVATGSGFGFGHRLVTRDGEVRHVESRGVPILDERGNLEHVVGFTMDVTARVRTRQLLEAKTSEVEATNARLRQALADLEENFEAMVLALVKAVEAKDPYTAGHSERVMGYSVRIGRALGLSPHELRVLRMGTLIHDVGKIGVPDAILTKPAPLSFDEYAAIQAHPAVGARMIEGIPMFKECIPIVLLHHERLDGSGYPFGIGGDAIPLAVRIAAVADCFDAMTSTRAYRDGLDPAFALEALWKSVEDGALDGRIVHELADTVRRDGLIAHESLRSVA